MTPSPPAAVVVLAAGQGRRMRSGTPKVLHEICGRSLLGHVLAAVGPLGAARTVVVVGHGRDLVSAALEGTSARPVVQAEQLGTGHALRTALDDLGPVDPADEVVVVPGDTPLLDAGTLAALVAHHRAEGADVTLLTAEVADPTGFGRVVRDADGRVIRIVEEADADGPTRAVREVATSVYVFRAGPLARRLEALRADNAQGEQYLTDVVAASVPAVAALTCADPAEVTGVNDRVQLAEAGRLLRDRLLRAAMLAGVTVVDPATTWLGPDVTFEPDCVIAPNTQLHGRTRVGAGAAVGPNTTLTDTVVARGASVVASTCSGADIGPDAVVGPYAHLRPGSRVGRGAKVGAFVEVKASDIGDGTKVPHLSYVGDATVGPRSNIGAATVFVNFDGRAKHRTVVGADVRIGSDTMLVAPVSVGDGAYTAAGSVITEDVPAGALGVGRARQRNVEGWVARRRGGGDAHRDPGPPGPQQRDGARQADVRPGDRARQEEQR